MAKKYGFALNPEDLDLIDRLRAKLEPTLGKVSNIQVIRWALRQAAQ